MDDEEQRACPLQTRAHQPQIATISFRIPPWQVITRTDGEQKQSVEIGKDRWKGGRYAEERCQTIRGQQQKGPYDRVVEA